MVLSFVAPASKPLFIAGVALSAYASGAIASISLISVPVIFTLKTESSFLTAWRKAYVSGFHLAPYIAFTAVAAHATNAYLHWDSFLPATSYHFMAAAIGSAAIVPFTLLMMLPTNNELFRREESARGTDEKVKESSMALLRKWSVLNFVRSLLPAVGAIAALTAL